MLNFRQANLLKAAPGAAFTILELLIVVCIIAILIGFALPAYLSTKEKALRRKAVVTAKHLELAFNEYYNQNQIWPPRDAPGDYRVKGAALGALGLFKPDVLKPLQKAWMGLGVVLGFFVSRIIMAVLFYLIITPVGFIMKLFGKDILDQRIDKNKTSYWHELPVVHKPKESYENQY